MDQLRRKTDSGSPLVPGGIRCEPLSGKESLKETE